MAEKAYIVEAVRTAGGKEMEDLVYGIQQI